tara:strand:- start:46 stop:648 length:603 start_codon:yes stop_codon:yes gene_type:complete
VFLKKNNLISFCIGIILILPISTNLNSKENEDLIKSQLTEYIIKIKEFSSNFIQTYNEDFQEGRFYLKNKRLRIEYLNPKKIVIIIKENNAMYFNIDLEEVQYFKPKNTVAEVFFGLFYDTSFLNNAQFIFDNNSFKILKSFDIDDEKNIITITFEKSPLNIRRIEIENSQGRTSFGIINLNYNPNLDDKMFSLANPLLG